jgi:PleD family two-component response regulator
MDGFTFYEKLRELNHLKHIPFAFLTGLNDNVLIRAGKELGVDDFLFKPIAPEDLILAIRGRLKRFEQLSLH